MSVMRGRRGEMWGLRGGAERGWRRKLGKGQESDVSTE